MSQIPPPTHTSSLPLSQLTVAQLRTLERMAWKYVNAIQKMAKTVPAMKPEYERANREWCALHDALKANLCAAAARRDKGAVLVTVFRPSCSGYCMEETTITPSRRIFHMTWRGEPKKKFSEDLLDKYSGWLSHFRRAMEAA